MPECRAGEKGAKMENERDIHTPLDDLVVKRETIDAGEVISMVTRSLQSAILTQDRCTCPMGLDNAAENLVRLLNARRQSKADASRKNRRVTISEDAIKSVFHLPISKAAAELGVGLTVSLFLRGYFEPLSLLTPVFSQAHGESILTGVEKVLSHLQHYEMALSETQILGQACLDSFIYPG